MSNLSSKIFSIDDITVERVVVPEWDNIQIELHSLTAGERGEVMSSASSKDANGESSVDIGQMYALCVIKSACDPTTGEQIFEDSDITAIKSRNGAVIERLAIKIMGTSAMGDKAVGAAYDNFPTKS